MTTEPNPFQLLFENLKQRFGDIPGQAETDRAGLLNLLAGHGVSRAFRDAPVDDELLTLICACALSAPSKSDLQQRDIIVISDPVIRKRINDLLNTDWVSAAPVMLMVCANGRRIKQIAAWREKPFPNDHLDLLFNSTGDAAICLGWLQLAAEAAGLGGCPLSVVRDHAAEISELLELPEGVIPFAGFVMGWPARPSRITPRLPLSMTLHNSRFGEGNAEAEIDGYDKRRAEMQPYRRQRDIAEFGEMDFYGWSEDKARQYATPHRADFGAYVRKSRFKPD